MSIGEARRAHVAVAGGGFTGMVCALRLLRAGYQVTVLEAEKETGGLTGSYDFGPFRWDRFYHCILTSDKALLDVLEELGLASQIRWTETQVGFFSHGRLHTMTSAADMLRFPHLSLLSKVRLGLATVHASHIRDGARLEAIPLEGWTKRLFGAEVHREIWEPLFRCKLGELRHQASAAFLWGTLRRLYSTRGQGPAKKERLGYVRGGYSVVFARLRERVLKLGATIETGERIEQVAWDDGTEQVAIGCGTRRMHFDAAILTLPNRVVARVVHPENREYIERLHSVQYLGLICVVLLLRERLSPFYVTNITEESPFTGLIEMTNLIDRKDETDGLHLVYLPRYTRSSDSLFDASEETVWETFAPMLYRMHPQLTEDKIAARFLFRERVVQPVPTLHYSQIVPAVETPVRGVYLANTAQIVNNTLNNNVMTGIANAACSRLMQDVPVTPVRGEICLPA